MNLALTVSDHATQDKVLEEVLEEDLNALAGETLAQAFPELHPSQVVPSDSSSEAIHYSSRQRAVAPTSASDSVRETVWLFLWFVGSCCSEGHLSFGHRWGRFECPHGTGTRRLQINVGTVQGPTECFPCL